MTDRQVPIGGTHVTEGLPTERLSQEAQNFFNALAEKTLTSITERIGEATDRLVDHMEHGGPGIKSAISGGKALLAGKSPFRAALNAGATGLKEKVKQIFGRGGGKGKALKLTNIVEQVDVGVPIRLAYDQWTQFKDFPSFMKKIEGAEQESEEKVNWKVHIWWSHRNWESTIIEQVPDDHIVWRSKGPKGYVDGVVSFSELAPNLTRILLVMEYHPQGFFEHTGNLWRAQGRRARLECKHFRRHVMAHAILQPDEIEGWRGEIRDGEVVKTHEEALDEEELERKQREAEGEPEITARKEEGATEGEARAGREDEQPVEEDRDLAGERDEVAEGEIPEEEEVRAPAVEEPEDSRVKADEEAPAVESPRARSGQREEMEKEEKDEKEVRRRRPPAKGRAPAPRRPVRRGEDEYEDDKAEAGQAAESTRGRPPPRRRSGAR